MNFTASVSNDSSGKGVTWTMSGTGCSGSACGTFTNRHRNRSNLQRSRICLRQHDGDGAGNFCCRHHRSRTSTPVVVSPAPTITTTTLANGAVGTAYNASLQVTGGAGTLTWSLASGSSLPAGLSLSSLGTISGTPTTAGKTTFTVKVTDASGGKEGPCSQTQQLSIMITSAPLTIIDDVAAERHRECCLQRAIAGFRWHHALYLDCGERIFTALMVGIRRFGHELVA